ncbi:MAG: 1,2-phenylacetyl-CoA epoxidase subunit PaaC [Flavobacteriia bacterium]|jgi:ring-1,2-phenylacetyl-CoA epoxidase subunit PaaC
MKTTLNYYLQIADNALILSHRLAENTSKGPFLEEDLATTNVALDLIGLAESVLNEAAKLEGLGQTGDDLAYRREESEFMNCLLVEQPNRDFAHIVTRQFLMDTFNYHYFIALTESKDSFLSAIAFKSIKEVTYHLRRSSEWMIRLGTGTDESKHRVQLAINTLWKFTDELFEQSDADKAMLAKGAGVNLHNIKNQWNQKVNEILYMAHLDSPKNQFSVFGGKQGNHTEHLGHILAEMQFLPGKYPDAVW